MAQREIEAADLEKSRSLPLLIAGTRLQLKSAAPTKLAALMQRAYEIVDRNRPEERLLLADLLFDAKRYGEAAAQFRRSLAPNSTASSTTGGSAALYEVAISARLSNSLIASLTSG